MIIIGISGKARSGKTTVANIIKKQVKASVDIISFADSLKDEVAHACGVSRTFLEGNKSTFRPILQWWGTEYRRKLMGPDDYWIYFVAAKVLESKAQLVVIPDVRFLNEAEWIKSFPTGYLVRMERQGSIKESSHISETELDKRISWDFIMDNNGPVEDLEYQTKIILKNVNLNMQPKAQLVTE